VAWQKGTGRTDQPVDGGTDFTYHRPLSLHDLIVEPVDVGYGRGRAG